jgi:hypothetical protein
MMAFEQTVRVPRCVEKRVPVTYTRCVPRTICCRVPVDPCLVPVPSSGCATGCAPVTIQPAPAEAETLAPDQSTEDERPTIAPDQKVPETKEEGQPVTPYPTRPTGVSGRHT